MTKSELHVEAWRRLLAHLRQRADQNAEFGYPNKELPAPEQLELLWDHYQCPAGYRMWTVMEMPAPGAILTNPMEAPDSLVDYTTHLVEPIIWSYIRYSQELADASGVQHEYWWYGLGLHPTERTFILFHAAAEPYEVLAALHPED